MGVKNRRRWLWCVLPDRKLVAVHETWRKPREGEEKGEREMRGERSPFMREMWCGTKGRWLHPVRLNGQGGWNNLSSPLSLFPRDLYPRNLEKRSEPEWTVSSHPDEWWWEEKEGEEKNMNGKRGESVKLTYFRSHRFGDERKMRRPLEMCCRRGWWWWWLGAKITQKDTSGGREAKGRRGWGGKMMMTNCYTLRLDEIQLI